MFRLRGARAAAVLATAVVTLAGVAPLAGQAPAPQAPKSAASAAPAVEALPAARTIVDRHVQAIGGRAAVLGYSSSHATGTVSIAGSGMSGTVEMYAAAKPNRTLLRITIPGVGEIASGFDGTHGWTMSPLTGPMLQQGKELEQAGLDADFYGELRDPADYTSLTTVEKTTFEGRPCYKVRLVRRDGGDDFDFYDVATGLRAGSINTRESSMGSMTATSVESDYKKFGKLLQPTTITTRTMGVEETITIAAFEYDSVPPAVFEAPAEIKALIK
ncbi:MAG TPA: hypothetical protein VFX12_06195 [Vicinamibacterales bacterium]|nr:hypothetical protein [Vicinamibacterales bacterium]